MKTNRYTCISKAMVCFDTISTCVMYAEICFKMQLITAMLYSEPTPSFRGILRLKSTDRFFPGSFHAQI